MIIMPFVAPQQDMHLELQKEKETLETNTGDLKKSVAELNEYVQAQKERERLLVAFPELSPLARAQPQSRQSLNICLVKVECDSRSLFATCLFD